MAQNLGPKGVIISLQVCPGYRKPMNIVTTAEAIENLGLKNDKHAIADSSRQVLLMEKETLDKLGLQPGQVKENITTTGINLMGLGHKQRLRIGSEVILEVTKGCAPCSRMEEIRAGLLKEIAGKRGMLTRVIRGGIISSGDIIEVMMG
jgi:MOSC domain-containing protein YiiM